MSCLRAVLLYNQLGLVLDDFEREYKVTTGKTVPFKLFGFNSTLELLHNSPDVVKVLQLDNAPAIVLPVVDEKTLHVAKLVGNQEFRTNGFNRRTGEVMSRLDERTVNKISQEVGFRDREVSALVKSQFRELLEMDANLNGILLSELPSEYYKIFSYHIDYEEYGFRSLEDFCLNGLSSDVDVDLDCGNFKIVEKGLIGRTKSISVPKDIPDQVKSNIKSLMRNPVMKIEDLRKKYFDNIEPLKLLEFGVQSFAELCLLLPDCLLVKGEEVRHPVTEEQEEKKEDGNRGDLSQVAVNVTELLQGRKDCLDLRDFIRGYEGFHGSIHKAVKEAGAKGVKQLLSMLEDVCYLETSASEQTVVGSTQASLSGKVQLIIITSGQGWDEY